MGPGKTSERGSERGREGGREGGKINDNSEKGDGRER